MLLLSSARNGSSNSVCIRCTYHLRLQALQQKRLRSSRQSSKAVRHDDRDSDGDGDGGDAYGFPRQWRPRNFSRKPDSLPTDDAFENAPKDASRKVSDLRKSKWANNLFRVHGSAKKEDFRPALQSALKEAREHLKNAPVLEQVAKEKHEWDGASGREFGFSVLWNSFTSLIMRGGTETANLGPSKYKGQSLPATDPRSIWNDLSEAFRFRGKSYLEDRIRYHFYGHVTGSRFSESDIRNQQAIADLRFPTEWYPATRVMRRKIHLHVGPTNSGKTYQALQRLEQANTGAYGGPLRLLAHEIYSRLNAKGKRCALITGEEKRMAPGTDFVDANSYDMQACTVEMLPQNKTVDVCVIDEIQMIGNPDRGWAWTQALLGIKAKEVHLCGEERTVPVIKELCASVGEELTIHHYQRLSPLAVAEESLDGDLRKLRKGDCIVSFSVMGIHALRKQIEQATNRKVATVYGSLPPETRAQQARLFNDPNNDYDFLVASDAVGMGLNLAIKRIIFESSNKFNGITRQTLSVADIKQIGGRAGRFRIAEQAVEGAASIEQLAAAKGEPVPADTAVGSAAAGIDPDQARFDQAKDAPEETLGLVTTLERFDFPIVRAAMESEPEPITSAGLYPPAAVLERFAGYFPPGTPFSYVLTRLHELSQVNSRFHLCGLKDQVYIADLVEGVQGLTTHDRLILTNSPASKQDNEMWTSLFPVFAKCIATQSGGNLADMKELPLELLEGPTKKGKDYLRNLERLHKGIVAYLWLSYRFAGIFTTRAMAQHAKRLVEDKIEETLSQFSFSEAQRRKLAALREKALLEEMMKGQGEEGVTETAPDEGVATIERVEDEDTDKMADMAHEPKQAERLEESSVFDELGSDLEGREASLRFTRTGSVEGGRFSGEEDEQFEEPELLKTASEEPNGRTVEDSTTDSDSPADFHSAGVTRSESEEMQGTKPTAGEVDEASPASEAAEETTSEPGSEPDMIPGIESEVLTEPLSPVEEAREEEKSSTDMKP